MNNCVTVTQSTFEQIFEDSIKLKEDLLKHIDKYHKNTKLHDDIFYPISTQSFMNHFMRFIEKINQPESVLEEYSQLWSLYGRIIKDRSCFETVTISLPTFLYLSSRFIIPKGTVGYISQ